MKKILIISVLTLCLLVAGFFVGVKFTSNGISNVSSTTVDGTNNSIIPSINTTDVLDLSNKGLTKAPDYVFNRTSIEELNLSNNKITGALQSQVQNLKNLKVLNLSNNNFTGVPAEIGQLRNLEVLNLSNNQITGLPYELGNLSKLKLLDLSGNNYSELDLSKIRQALPSSVVIKTK